jgi:hypothetical protein
MVGWTKIVHKEYESNGQTLNTTFKYTEPFANHSTYRVAVETIITIGGMMAPTRVYHWRLHGQLSGGRTVSLLLCSRSLRSTCTWHAAIFSKEEENFMEFRKKLAYALLHNTMDEGLAPASRPNTRGSNLSPGHELVRAPKNAKFEDGEWRTSNADCMQPDYR